MATWNLSVKKRARCGFFFLNSRLFILLAMLIIHLTTSRIPYPSSMRAPHFSPIIHVTRICRQSKHWLLEYFLHSSRIVQFALIHSTFVNPLAKTVGLLCVYIFGTCGVSTFEINTVLSLCLSSRRLYFGVSLDEYMWHCKDVCHAFYGLRLMLSFATTYHYEPANQNSVATNLLFEMLF